MADWVHLPDGNFINLDEVEFIDIKNDFALLKTSTREYRVELDGEWRKRLISMSCKTYKSGKGE